MRSSHIRIILFGAWTARQMHKLFVADGNVSFLWGFRYWIITSSFVLSFAHIHWKYFWICKTGREWTHFMLCLSQRLCQLMHPSKKFRFLLLETNSAAAIISQQKMRTSLSKWFVRGNRTKEHARLKQKHIVVICILPYRKTSLFIYLFFLQFQPYNVNIDFFSFENMLFQSPS